MYVVDIYPKMFKNPGTSLQSSMSMLNFYINRAGSKLKEDRKKILEQAKIEVRQLYKHAKSQGNKQIMNSYSN